MKSKHNALPHFNQKALFYKENIRDQKDLRTLPVEYPPCTIQENEAKRDNLVYIKLQNQ